MKRMIVKREQHTWDPFWLTFVGGFLMDCKWPPLFRRIADCIALRQFMVTYRSALGLGWSSPCSRYFLVYDISWLFGLIPVSFCRVREISSSVVYMADDVKTGLQRQQELLREVMPTASAEQLMSECKRRSWVYRTFEKRGWL